jgi:4'-phosphopantetheinyl transferase EntD
VIEQLIPPGAVSASSDGGIAATSLLPAEAALIVGAAAKRQQEFATGRSCARLALAGLGFSGHALLRGAGGEPRWPDGIVGSITHCRGYCAAAVARRADLPGVVGLPCIVGLGIDAAPNTPAHPSLSARVGGATEVAALHGLSTADPAVLLFSATEAIYKAVYPFAGIQLRFSDSVVRFNPASGRFAARLRHPRWAGPVADHFCVVGRWAVTANHVCSVATVSWNLAGPAASDHEGRDQEGSGSGGRYEVGRDELFGHEPSEPGRIAADKLAAQPYTVDVAEHVGPPRRIG